VHPQRRSICRAGMGAGLGLGPGSCSPAQVGSRCASALGAHKPFVRFVRFAGPGSKGAGANLDWAAKGPEHHGIS